MCIRDSDRIWLEGESIIKGLGLTTIDTKALKNINLDTSNSIVLNSVLIYKNKIQGTLDTHDKEFAIIQGDLENVKFEVKNVKCEVFNNKRRIQAIEEKLNECTRHQGNFKENVNYLSLDTIKSCLLYTSPSPRDATLSRMPSSA